MAYEPEHGLSLAQFRLIVAQGAKFLESLPDDIPCPEWCNDPDGEMDFDWWTSPLMTISVSVGATGSLAIAWIIGTDKGHCTGQLGEFPDGFLDRVRRVTSAEKLP